jgi:uncharacterized membrane protein SpoIIM required for sporulation
MLESLINPKKAERRPWEMLFVGFLYGVVSLILVNLIFMKSDVFANHASIIIVLFTTILCLPFFYYLVLFEERKEIKLKKERKILGEHGKAMLALLFLFLGLLLSYTLFTLLMPHEIVKKNFETQIYTYCSINMPYNIKSCIDFISEGRLAINKPRLDFKLLINRFFNIFLNNLYVLLFCLIFSFVFGSGAIFILSWNASVIAVAIGSLAKAKNFPIAFLHYMLHGLPEITAYFIASLAGGIISIAMIRHEYKHKEFWIVLQDSIDLILISILFLILAAIIEVVISPFVL